jgi:hypothetical protein
MSQSNQATYNSQQELNQTMQEPTTLGTMQHTIQPQITQPANPFDLNGMFLNFLTHAVMQANAPLLARIAELETKLNNLQDTNANFIKEIADEVAREVLCEHSEEYDHDGYDRLADKIDDAVADMDIETEIKRALQNATISISV